MPRRSQEAREVPPRGSYEYLEEEVAGLGPWVVGERHVLGLVPQTSCLVHGRHEVKVEWESTRPVLSELAAGGWRLERVYIPHLLVSCTQVCGPVFLWGGGCGHAG